MLRELFTLWGTPTAGPMSVNPYRITPIHWLKNHAVSDAITSSAHTGERAIHSSDFSAFTKRSHYPSLLRFSGPTYLLRSSICTSATASVELCSPRGEVPWNTAVVNRRARDSSLAMTRTDK